MDTIYVGDYRGNWVIKIGGHVITKLILTVESVCAQPVEEGQPCTDLDMSDLVDIDEALDGVQINLLQVLDNEPVFFSKFAIPLGTYWDVELNLVPDMQFIEIDGGTHRLNLSNGGNVLVLFGKYTLDAEGGLFNLYFDFVASENISSMSGIGYTLRSALLLNQEEPLREISGCYHGKMPYLHECGELEDARLNIDSNYFNLVYSKHPDITVSGRYQYNSEEKYFYLYNISAKSKETCGFLDLVCWGKKQYIENLNIEALNFYLSNWDADNIYTSICEENIHLKKVSQVNQCGLPVPPPPTLVNMTVENIRSEWIGKALVIEFRRADFKKKAVSFSFEISQVGSFSKTLEIPNSQFELDIEQFIITGYIIESAETAIISPETGGLGGSFMKSTKSNAENQNSFSIHKLETSNNITRMFPKTLNIYFDPPDLRSFRINIGWDPHPNVVEYRIYVTIPDRDMNDGDRLFSDSNGESLRIGDGDPYKDILFYTKTITTKIPYFGERIDPLALNLINIGNSKYSKVPVNAPITVTVSGFDPNDTEIIRDTLKIIKGANDVE